jgi:hypothetical protein
VNGQYRDAHCAHFESESLPFTAYYSGRTRINSEKILMKSWATAASHARAWFDVLPDTTLQCGD